tara:strand:+ start:1795 stop:1914 length:120 start_codon:yes stop_codon:yes gene_type:complete
MRNSEYPIFTGGGLNLLTLQPHNSIHTGQALTRKKKNGT